MADERESLDRNEEIKMLYRSTFMTMKEIGETFKISKARVSQILEEKDLEERERFAESQLAKYVKGLKGLTNLRELKFLFPTLGKKKIEEILQRKRIFLKDYAAWSRDKTLLVAEFFGELKERGKPVSASWWAAPFFGTVGETKIDFVFGVRRDTSDKLKSPMWRFKVGPNKTGAEALILFTEDGDRFVIPTEEIPEGKRYLQFCWPSENGKSWQRFHDENCLLSMEL